MHLTSEGATPSFFLTPLLYLQTAWSLVAFLLSRPRGMAGSCSTGRWEIPVMSLIMEITPSPLAPRSMALTRGDAHQHWSSYVQSIKYRIAPDLTMSRKYFVKFVSEPRNDTIKTIVGVACAARAISEGHEVSVFFAAAGTRLLEPAYIEELDKEMGEDSTVVSDMMGAITENATLYCSFASVKATLGHSEGDGALIVPDDKIKWSGPPGVIELSSASEVQLVY